MSFWQAIRKIISEAAVLRSSWRQGASGQCCQCVGRSRGNRLLYRCTRWRASLCGTRCFERTLAAAKVHGAAIAAVPVKDTIKVVGTDGIVTATPERSMLMAVQTPQIFTAELLKQAYAQLAAHPAAVTDDASVVELMGHKVATALGRYENIKITTPEDLLFAENLLAQQEQEDGK